MYTKCKIGNGEKEIYKLYGEGQTNTEQKKISIGCFMQKVPLSNFCKKQHYSVAEHTVRLTMLKSVKKSLGS